MSFIGKDKDKAKVSALVPCWNEGGRIGVVLSVLVECNQLDEIIVIDDGSTDSTAAEVEEMVKNHRKLKLISHENNKGKTDAIITGLSAVKGDMIVMVDADLQGLTEADINKLINPLRNDEYDMIILDRWSDRASVIGWTGFSRFYGGERSFWKKDIEDLNLYFGEGYLIESKMNMHYLNKKLRVKTVFCKNLFATKQFDKHGFFVGLIRYISMFYKMIAYAKPIGMYKMITRFEEDRLERVYGLNRKLRILGPFILICVFFLSLYTFSEVKIKSHLP